MRTYTNKEAKKLYKDFEAFFKSNEKAFVTNYGYATFMDVEKVKRIAKEMGASSVKYNKKKNVVTVYFNVEDDDGYWDFEIFGSIADKYNY